ncbi:monovalent cation:proton antiporter-2 (CPA2) family protein [Pelagibacterium halotolerans]|uniref:Glutathione-regulated potassium-efflux system protein KefB n=1 Tax=Pelagibacterium halotolerans (strain DSM 22347 / JCM 15775 / CGMCC 1.7692 / B2) TaxID=1082931 RepID=G4R8Q5_PELHB|nr:monovalent cation:proton antiporter-2 (CPA2) family protein [Pelagibacterium halotolerans]AEQ50341.1 glutathione-regulated potassium-efflux system protein KefB [Pelagibacterium halotolerans B2]QJR19678.1 potassium transporter [Pelagibacterium halotolerans]SEA98290.1 Kef-type potassium/proton antiporter, CPA2 family [Pelagibacterium halotolerans]
MAGEAAHGFDLFPVVGILAAGVVAVPIFKRIGLGSVLGYLAAGLAIGPFGLAVVTHPETILHTAELGVVMFLFVIGLEMQPRRLWSLRKQIFGLGILQVGTCAALMTGAGILMGLSPTVALIAGLGFVLTSTAIVFQVLEERGEIATPAGQKMVSVLLLEDLAIVPLLALVAFIAPQAETVTMGQRLTDIAIAVGALVALVLVGRFLLNPLFRILANAHAREVMTAAALLVVLGAALAMNMSGLSMAMGAFLAGVLLSESTFRHQLEADIEPFRGILLGLFFIAVGMSLDLGVIAQNYPFIIMAVVVYMAVKFAGIYGIARLLRSSHGEALERSVLMAQGGEFAFVLFSAALGVGILDAEMNAILTTTVIVSMVLTPIAIIGMNRIMPRETPDLDGVEIADGLAGTVLIIGFGRFSQIVSQPLLAKGVDVTIIDNDVEMIQAAARFGFKIYYGDGTRPEILHAAGASTATAILVCIDKPADATLIAAHVKSEYPLAQLYVRAFDREHAVDLVHLGVDYQIREVLESAFVFGYETLVALGVDEQEAADILEEVRERDKARFELDIAGGLSEGAALMLGNAEGPRPTPSFTPRRKGSAINPEAAEILQNAEVAESQ